MTNHYYKLTPLYVLILASHWIIDCLENIKIELRNDTFLKANCFGFF